MKTLPENTSLRSCSPSTTAHTHTNIILSKSSLVSVGKSMRGMHAVFSVLLNAQPKIHTTQPKRRETNIWLLLFWDRACVLRCHAWRARCFWFTSRFVFVCLCETWITHALLTASTKRWTALSIRWRARSICFSCSNIPLTLACFSAVAHDHYAIYTRHPTCSLAHALACRRSVLSACMREACNRYRKMRMLRCEGVDFGVFILWARLWVL